MSLWFCVSVVLDHFQFVHISGTPSPIAVSKIVMKAISFGTAFLTLAFAAGTLAQISRPMTGEPWRLWGGPQLDFTSKAKDIFPATGEKWLSNPPRKIW